MQAKWGFLYKKFNKIVYSILSMLFNILNEELAVIIIFYKLYKILQKVSRLMHNIVNTQKIKVFYFNISLLITNFCISLVPSPIVQSLLSR